MRKTLSTFVSLLVVVPLLAPGVLASPSDDEDVRKAVKAREEAWERHDMEAFAKLFAPDADYVNVVGKWTKGRRAIQTSHAYLHGTISVDTPGVGVPRERYGAFKTSKLRLTQIDVRFLRKDVAVTHESWEMTDDARTMSPRKFVLTAVLTREDGVWLIAALQDTEIRPPLN
jgi:ketosteroid isomerase-like protein